MRRASDGTTQDIGTASAGGQVDLAALSSFCSGTTCSVSILYDQTANANDLKSGLVLKAATTNNGPATANNEPMVQYWTSSTGTQLPMALTLNDSNQHPGGQWLRNRTTTHKVPTGSQSQTEYMVVHAAYFGGQCCYDYGNMENHIGDDGPGTMNALYFGNSNSWTQGAGAGPWAMADMENGLFAGGGNIQDPNNGNGLNVNASDPTIKYSGSNIASILTKTNGTTTWELKVGDAVSGAFQTAWNGSLPSVLNPTSYLPLKQEGGLSLGEGGDGSNNCTGAFSEGVVIAGETTDATDNAIQTNLNAVYGQ